MSAHSSPPREPDRLAEWLADAGAVRAWLAGLGVREPARAAKDLRDLLGRGASPSTGIALLDVMGRALPSCPDPGMAIINLDRYVAAHPFPNAALTALGLDARSAEILIQLFSTSQSFGELVIRDPDVLPWLRGGAERWDRDTLVEHLWEEIRSIPQDSERLLALRRFRRRELLRIGYNDIVRGMPLEVVTQDISHLADACIEVAYRMAWAGMTERYGTPRGPGGEPARFVVIAMGKLGGEELNYSSDIDLIYLYDDEGACDRPRPLSNAEFFAKLGGELTRVLSDFTPLGMAYRVDLRLRPDGDQGPLARSLEAALGYYETSGRTWERQALIKCRPAAGDLELGAAFVAAITPWVYQRYLSAVEIGEIQAMKRRIERHTAGAGAEDREVKTGRGGIRDVEFVVQFLQLLNGGTDPSVRHPNTIATFARLQAAGCLTIEERGIMEETYRFLRKVEHRLQTVFDRQTHELPRDPEALRALALRMDVAPVAGEPREGPAKRFLAEYRAMTERNRTILNHLLHNAFPREGATHPVVDLVLDPDPGPEQIVAALKDFPFKDPKRVNATLRRLASEEIPFLSQARCRHFLAAIAPRLLAALGNTPDPDQSLINLEQVSASLGAKAVLWELFSSHPPSLRLYVELCANSPFLSEVLVNNPGMIDDLMDSMVDDRPRIAEEIHQELEELCRGAEDLAPILLSFRNKEWVRIGARCLLKREPIREVVREISDVAQAIVAQVARDQRLRARREGISLPDGWAIVALGKLGGRELSFHSDLDLIFLHNGEGEAEHGFERLIRRFLSALGGSETGAPLYTVDPRLRPYGADGPLVTSLEAFRGYHESGAGQTWERLALTRARVVFAAGDFGLPAEDVFRGALTKPCRTDQLSKEIAGLRARVDAANPRAKGLGSMSDVEWIVQYLQLASVGEHPEILEPNVWGALESLADAGLLPGEGARALVDAYDFLAEAKNRLRILKNWRGNELPKRPEDLARLSGRESQALFDLEEAVAEFRAEYDLHEAQSREWFARLVGGGACGR